MATWTVTIEVANLNSKQANISATRTDGPDVRTFELPRVSLDTHDKPGSQIRQEIVDACWAKFQQSEADAAATTTLLSGYEAALATDLNALEV